MKRFCAILLIVSMFVLSGCGALYTGIKTPMPDLNVPIDGGGMSKSGKSSCASYVRLIGTGDCSISAAMKDGGITKIHHVDTEVLSVVLGIYMKFTTVVYGE